MCSLERDLPQKMSFQQGLAVPILCSISLFGFYCVLRFFPEVDLKTFFSIYLAFAGSLAVASNLVDPVRYIFPETTSFSRTISNSSFPIILTVFLLFLYYAFMFSKDLLVTHLCSIMLVATHSKSFGSH